MLTENITPLEELEKIYVNALIYFDEECDDDYRRSRYWEDFFEYGGTWMPSKRFKDNWDIEFVGLNDHNDFWDSLDSRTDAVDLLQEAIKELGGVFDGESVKGNICYSALMVLLPKIFAMLYGVEFPWAENKDVIFNACPDADNPVVFEIRRVEK